MTSRDGLRFVTFATSNVILVLLYYAYVFIWILMKVLKIANYI